MPSGEYVDITVALSLFTQISTFLSSIIAITIGISKRDKEQAKEKIQALQTFLFKTFIILAVVFFVLSPTIMPRMHVSNLFVLPITLMMLFSIPISVISGYLNGINALAKLGLVALISAATQFFVAYLVAITSHNGFFTMLAMTVAQLTTITIIYKIYASMHLPNLGISLSLRNVKNSNQYKQLMFYTVGAAISVMAVSIAQISDLLILQNIKTTDVKFYTDIYVISRIVFFAGMILIWPFLGQLHISPLRRNIRPFIKLVSSFGAIGVLAIIGLLIGGDLITRILFGSPYNISQIQLIGGLSVLFKVWMLIITAATLYFVVLHRVIAFVIAVVTSLSLIIYASLVSQTTTTAQVLIHLNVISGLVALILIGYIIANAYRKK